jgi:membrane protein DedA with SNARE-associated domain/rhodanese-related sulfurtransferase
MKEVIEFLIQHGYTVVFVWVFAEQIGLPVPAAPLLLASGALAGEGLLRFPIVLSIAFVASLLSDVLWFLVGRYRGSSVLHHLCRISLNPDSCIRNTANLFARYGSWTLLAAKFMPGLSTAAPPLAGIFQMHPARFLLFDGLGACLWVGACAGVGYLLSDQIEQIAGYATRLGISLGLLLLTSLAAYIIWKYIQRRRFLSMLRMARITPEELKEKLDAGEDLMILDVRHPLEFQAEPQTIPGALFVPPEQLGKNNHQIPPDREIILYCNCPNEASSAMAAVKLRELGITRVRPLAGGFSAWRERAYPLESRINQ